MGADHRDDGRGWLGASHRSFNARAGWEKLVARNGSAAQREERPYRWSQRWSDDPPIGTTANARPGMVELHLGGMPWARIGEHVGQRNLAVTANTYTHVLTDENELDHSNLDRVSGGKTRTASGLPAASHR
jgi:hypothetical protein